MKKHKVTSTDVITYIITQYSNISNYKLHLLLYICYSEYLVQYKKELFKDYFIACNNQPVLNIPSKKDLIKGITLKQQNLPNKVYKIIDLVLKHCIAMEYQFMKDELTKSGTPYYVTPKFKRIKKSLIENYFD